ncbi:hypothetical protein GRI97_06965 [Altererythrobacter xixiisoli]|uniref:TauD/TfdA-like domain-containing protein n=1 Tax=Croceibacterium xixiisoli TaxID=1476466 RepID=A0A6I4TWK7_9SPHN|nr:TauD/TfdA family dioxygenase [Croceibacterium xixiisoli]MXO98723.1 hypothetical protein [Croceibacterium xixiisoli]
MRKLPMVLAVRQVHPRFFGEITGADLIGEPDENLRNFVEQAMAEHAVCVVRHSPISDEQHLRFARLFGPLELPPGYAERKAASVRPRIAPEMFFAGNIDDDNQIIPPKPPSQDIGAGAQRFHADSSFNPQPSKWSMLRGVECPPSEVGGDTLFADMRAAFDDLPPEMQQRLEGLTGIHDFWKGREYAGLTVSDSMRTRFRMPPMEHPLVRTMANGRKSLFVGGHCTGVKGMSEEEGHELVEWLYRHTTSDQYVHRHQWVEGDIVIWENRCALHAATPLNTSEYRRDMRRATVNESGREMDAYHAAGITGASLTD